MPEALYRLDLMVEAPNSSGAPPIWQPSSYPDVMFGYDDLTADELAQVQARIRDKAGEHTLTTRYRTRPAPDA